MNWRKHAHLFANGKFKVLYEAPNNTDYETNTFPLTRKDADAIREYPEKRYPNWVKHCTLIARPISDMSDDEWDGLGYNGFENPKRQLLDDTKDKTLFNADFLYLLSIGVYPFDQNDFGKTVIDKSKLNEE